MFALSDLTGAAELLTLDEVCERLGMSVRNVRFYTSRGLVPPPLKRGRQGYYDSTHVARLELVNELQAHGFTLAAIERYVARIPENATPDAIRLHRTLLAPWAAGHPGVMHRSELDARAGRSISDREIEVLHMLDVIAPHQAADGEEPDADTYDVSIGNLDTSLALIRYDYPAEAALLARNLFDEHATAIADTLNEMFHTLVWPAYRASGASPEDLRTAVEAMKPITTAGLVNAYEKAVTKSVRNRIERMVAENEPDGA
ncbi:MerR family transcriptional regulator [Nocardioides sp. Bht2]|uniref:MerR family transcriptional regulator n=1 Tax=Nocardioides sp. Bht2 TaxID=3392297 RepID=UPI0039B44CB4